MGDNYIAKEEILSFVEELEKRTHGDDLITKTVLVTTKCVKDFVMHMPPADVQPVVRCKDCKHRNDYAYWLGCPILNTDDDNFCSYAERRTDEPQHETRHSTHHSATDAEQVP